MTTTQNLKLHQLAEWQGNVRKTAARPEDINSLAASILAHGLLQSLVVRPSAEQPDTYDVIAGVQRLTALRQLVTGGKIDAGMDIPCRVLSEDDDIAAEVSLAENTVRAAMHPADEFEAFRDLVEDGLSISEIGARFGVTDALVRQRLQLGKVHPEILEAYRADEGGKIDLDLVKAYASSDDQEAQLRVWQNQRINDSAWQVRQALAKSEMTADDDLVKIVTLALYEERGGGTYRDLFADDDRGIFILDPALVDALVQEKLQERAAELEAAGWSWVDIRRSFSYSDRSEFKQAEGEEIPLTPEQQAEYDKLSSEHEALEEMDWDERTSEQEDRMEELSEMLNKIDERPLHFSDEIKASHGAVVCIEYGEIVVKYGLQPKKAGAVKAATPPSGTAPQIAEPAPAKEPSLPANLVQEITDHRTDILATHLSQRPDIALATMVHNLALGPLYGENFGSRSCIDIRAERRDPIRGTAAEAEYERQHKHWKETLPSKKKELWAWCLEADRDQLLKLMAHLMAYAVDWRMSRADSDSESLDHAAQVAQAVNYSAAGHFTPSVDNYFKRVSKDELLRSLMEATGEAPDMAAKNMKRAPLAEYTAKRLEGTNWLPALLRNKEQDAAAKANLKKAQKADKKAAKAEADTEEQEAA